MERVFFISLVLIPSLHIVTPEVAHHELKHFININSDFGLRMYTILADNTAASVYGNILFSPLCVSEVFAILQLGSNNMTRKELDAVLGYGNTLLKKHDDEVHMLFQELMKIIVQKNNQFSLNIANGVFLSDKYPLLQSYVKSSNEYYSTPVMQMNFNEQNLQSQNIINSYVKNNTENKINNFLPFGLITPATDLVVVNAIYFQSKWFKSFDSSKTKKDVFTNHLGNQVAVPMMTMTSRFLYAKHDPIHAHVIELFYAGDQTSIMFFIPQEGFSLGQVYKKLNHNEYSRLLEALRPEPIVLSLPKFRILQNMDLEPVLHFMGVREIFHGQKADFSRMTSTKGLHVSRALHKAMFEVNEEGTEDLEATGSDISDKASGNMIVYDVNQPFMFVIRHLESNSILLMGRIGDPTQETSFIQASTSDASNNKKIGSSLALSILIISWFN